MNTILDAARRYVARGWALVPIPAGTKAPTLPAWQELRISEQELPQYFNGQPLNIGVLNGTPSGGSVDVDLDAAEAIAAAAMFLPTTGSLYGRPGKPASHRRYIVAPSLATKQFADPAGGMLVELRSTGSQTVLPPSVHPSGEHYRWAKDGTPAAVPWEDLEHAVGQVAAAALLARRWPPLGTRHDFALAVGGFLLRGGVAEDVAVRLVEVAARIAGTDGWKKRGNDVRDTARRMAEGIAITGAPTVEELLPDGRRVLEALRSWLQLRVPAPNLTDAGNAQRFAAQHGDAVRYCYAWCSWLLWTGQRWQQDPGEGAMRLAKATALSIYAEAQREPDEARRKAIAAWAVRSESEARLQAMLRLAQSEPGIPVVPDELDRDPFLLNTPTGTLDLRTLALRPHSREDLITKMTAAKYDPSAYHPIFDAFLKRVLPEPELRGFAQRLAGYALTGDTSEDKLFLVHGPTASGKSTFTSMLRAAWGDYATTADVTSFLVRRGDGPREDLARLAGTRLVISTEVDEGSRLAESLVKTLTGGDGFTARHLYQRTFEFRPMFKLVIVSNHRPRVRDDDDAIWRRILELLFPESIPEDERDPTVRRTLLDPAVAGPAVLAWAAAGAAEWCTQGLGTPSAVQQPTKAYREAMDPLKDFMGECCVIDPATWTPAGALWECYQVWCRENWEPRRLSQKDFGSRLRGLGGKPGTKNRGRLRVWHGIGLKCAVQGNGSLG